MAKFLINGWYYEHEAPVGKAFKIEIGSEEFATAEEAKALLALMPKSLGFKKVRCGFWDGRPDTYSVRMAAYLIVNKTTGAKNEAGLARYARLRKWAEKNGHSIEIGNDRCSNAFTSLEALHAAL